MDFELSDEQCEFQQAARAFAEGELAPHAAHWDAESIFPVETIAKAGEMGFCGLYTPQRWGGLGLSRQDAAIVFEELAGGCTSTTAYITIHNMATWMLSRWGQEALCDEWVPALAAGQKLASYCLTEPQSGSDAASLRTKARRVNDEEGDFYVLDGTKAFISGAGQTDMLIVMARTGGEGAAGISAFAVPANLPGIVYGKKEEKMGWNSQPTRIISFDQVKVPAANLLGAEGEGFAIAMKGIDGGRINIAVCSVGTAQAALTRAQAYMKERTQFGRELAQFQALQFKLADMLTELVAARQMVRLAAWKLDQESPDATAYCAMAKRFATDVGFNVANDALQLHGGYGYIREYPLERHVRDTRVHQILEGTNEIMRLIVARAILKDGATENLR
ncbi:acyl-CoA dehydrogenase family protein [Janthinobacterium lividum]|uniref:Acyl-CoA dehydrogenase family protein n=1 Tax=Janthinobacterium lividum TaxID=29581 RepID=A0ABU0XUZ4_9BURK|nr:acyl-CoA dehydrogenase family protein [Janthinobacterium lividum]MDQ4626784.1 acyl-CoA dehydrogenase family protein [Janthinobacterium lividum]MDQ4674249.1 acyl-CoA dehydrogenase family protein [Janthinobacterium lividum]MDQ4684980.1 acyl-CoA dehydrogenase family protein [Janthinobacterium lividum]